MGYNTEKDKIEYLNKLSLHMKQAIKGVDLILAYEGYKEGLELEDCLEYIENNRDKKIEEIEKATKELLEKEKKEKEKEKAKQKKLAKIKLTFNRRKNKVCQKK